MRRQAFRGFWFRHFPRYRSGKSQLMLATILGLFTALFLITRIDASLRPQLVMLAERQVRNQLTLIADQTVAQVLVQQSITYDDMVHLQAVPGEEITTLTTDTTQLNLFRSLVMDRIVTQVKNLDRNSLEIPIGTLTGVDILSALGPKFPVKILSVASAESDYRNDFTSAGINQTLHRIMLDVTITAELLLPGGIVEAEISTPVCIAETIIIGQVPQAYFNWYQ